MAFPRDAMGLTAVCDCGISRSYSLTIFKMNLNINNQNMFSPPKTIVYIEDLT